MQFSKSVVAKVVETLLDQGAKRVTAFLSPTLTVKATRKLFGKRIRKGLGAINVSLTIGRPNYAERKFIRDCQKAGEPFPVKKLQIKTVPNRNGAGR
jgi:hypothetical protein